MGQTLDLMRVAAEAERLRWLLAARRFVIRAGLLAAGMAFFVAAVIMAHMSCLAALEPRVGILWAAAILTGVDVAVALVLGGAAARLGPGAGERQAVAVRRLAGDELVRRIRFLRLLALVVGVFRR